MLGTKPAPMPWILCGPGWPPESTGLSVGSTAIALNDGFFGLMYSLTPVSVPPVPMPETRMSTLPSVSFQISGPGGLEMDLGIRRIVELLQHVAVRRRREHLLGLRNRALHAFRPGREHDLRAEGAQQHAALHAHGFRHGEDQLVAFDRGDERQPDAGVAAGRLDQHGLAGLNLSRALGLVRSC